MYILGSSQPFFYICIEQNRTKLLNSFRAYKSTRDIRIIGSIYLQRGEIHCYNDYKKLKTRLL